MIDYKYFDLFWHKRGSVNKDWKIEYDGGSFTDWDMKSESIELSESLCSETELRFGCCEASCLKFTVANIVRPLINEWITLSVSIDHHDSEPMMIGKYKIFSEKLTADRQYKEIVAYDAMYDIINADVSAWYNSVLPDKTSTMTMKQFRESFIRFFGLVEVVPEDGLVNDGMTVERTIDPAQISGLDVITAICEINGCFGHIGRDGKFYYIYLPQAIQGLYPADDLFPDHAPDSMPYQQETGHLYPHDPKGIRIDSNHYIDVDWENFYVQHITKLQIRQEENDIGAVYGTGDNCYIIQDNFLVYGKSSDQLSTIAENILSKITDIVYRPFDADVMGNPCFEVGDPVMFLTKYDIVESYILKRTLKGIQSLIDDYRAEGIERYSEEVNGVHSSIVQLKGKANILTRAIEETRLEMIDIEAGLKNEISITAEGLSVNIEKEQERAEEEEQKLGTSISAIAGEIVLKVDSSGKMALVRLEANPDTGTEFLVNAGNISLTAEDVFNLMSGGEFNLTAKDVNISSENWRVNSNGDMECRNITAFSISGNAVSQFNSAIEDSDTLKIANESLAAIKETIRVLNEVSFPQINKNINDLQIAVAGLEARVSALEAKKQGGQNE